MDGKLESHNHKEVKRRSDGHKAEEKSRSSGNQWGGSVIPGRPGYGSLRRLVQAGLCSIYVVAAPPVQAMAYQ